jgi:hypothetical protein
MKKYKTLYDKLRPEYMNILIQDIKNAPTSVKLAKKSLKSYDFALELTVSDLDRLSRVLDLDVTNKNVHRLFNNDNALRF